MSFTVRLHPISSLKLGQPLVVDVNVLIFVVFIFDGCTYL